MKRSYHTINKQGKTNARELGEFLSKNGQQLLPMVDLIEQCRMACDELIDVAGRATIQAVLDCPHNKPPEGHASRGSNARARWSGMADKRERCC